MTRSPSEKYKNLTHECDERDRLHSSVKQNGEQQERDKLGGKGRVMCGREGQADHSSIAPDIPG